MKTAVLICALVPGIAWSAGVYPPEWASGKADASCTVADICPHLSRARKHGRPPSEYTTHLKRQQLIDHPEIDCSGEEGCEEDHVISGELCGDWRDPENLAPQPYGLQMGAHQKDWVEDDLHRKVCAGTIPLETAQFVIAHQWVKYYRENRE